MVQPLVFWTLPIRHALERGIASACRCQSGTCRNACRCQSGTCRNDCRYQLGVCRLFSCQILQFCETWKTWILCFICRFILVLFSCPLLMECSLRFQREIAVHQFHILESILEEDSHICPKRKHKNFLFMLLFITKKRRKPKSTSI